MNNFPDWFNKSKLAKKLYDNIKPYEYSNAYNADIHDFISRIKNAIQGRSEYIYENGEFDPNRTDRDEIFATYLGIPLKNRYPLNNTAYHVEQSDYVPSNNSIGNTKYFKLSNVSQDETDRLIEDGLNLKTGGSSISSAYTGALGTHTVSRGLDKNRGEYISYYDLWDLNPFNGKFGIKNLYSTSFTTPKLPTLKKNYKDDSWLESIFNFDVHTDWEHKFIPITIKNPIYGKIKNKDISFGIGTPIEFYDRIYLDDYYGVNSKPEDDSYYGGYIIPSVITENKVKSIF